ncbi:hypothetical protein [Photobacterium leiognathi]|uniref:hypothetical protein n=1 Tax=Photobacterium leiognathi TaxID=553611 RepID=UPI002980F5B1|nr:hypothetical protein [Photobacterium leiognathi]
MCNSVWYENSKRNILATSQANDFDQALTEWFFTGKVRDYKHSRTSCEMCEHEQLRYQFIIKNKTNGNHLHVGSSCILKFSKIAIFDAHGKRLSGDYSRSNALDDALASLHKQLMLAPLRALWKANIKFRPFIEKHVKYFEKNSAFYPSALVALFKSLVRNHISYDPVLFPVYLRNNNSKEAIVAMTESDFKLIEPSLKAGQQKRIMEQRVKSPCIQK